VVSLEGDEQSWLARMHPKTRYNILLAGRKGIHIRPWDDLAAFGTMMQTTAERQAFGVHHPDYYRKAYEVFHPRGECELLVAEWEGHPLAALMAFARGGRAWYFYGGSTGQERARMPTYLLQWETMRWAADKGCTEYDLWGVPDHDETLLEAQFSSRRGGLWGVYRFKRGFGGRLIRSAGAWDRPYSRPLYLAYRLLFRRAAD
jgi:lipid II:glycine glycyltransferase (peptidoglycan interpeptide bridge formation enzyme)